MRRTMRITIEADNRDRGKTFLLTEMPAKKAERWAGKALSELARSGAEIPDDVMSAGLAGLAAMGAKSLVRVRFEDLEPLFDEMFECVQICDDKDNPDTARALHDDDIEEVVTRIKLRGDILGLHLNFSEPVAR